MVEILNGIITAGWRYNNLHSVVFLSLLSINIVYPLNFNSFYYESNSKC